MPKGMYDQTYRIDGTTQVVSYDSSTATTNAVGAQTYAVRVAVTTDCHVAFGAAPTATTSNPFMPAGSVEYFRVTPGQKLAFIKNASAGSAYVTECTR